MEYDIFKNLVLYIIKNCHEVGKFKLIKALYFIDCTYYGLHKKSLTGVTHYIKKESGPVLDKDYDEELIKILGSDIIKCEIGYKDDASYSINEDKYNESNSFLKNEMEKIVNSVLMFIKGKTEKELSNLTHGKSWHSKKIGEKIFFDEVVEVKIEILKPEEEDYSRLDEPLFIEEMVKDMNNDNAFNRIFK